MKLSDYIARFLQQQGIKHVFAVTGGASAHLIDSLAKTDGITYICPQHEQAGAMMADAYARTTGNMGAAIATSGPGATNLLTGTACSYYDSIPVLYLTGQVSVNRLRGDSGVRQKGFQETDTEKIFRPVTKNTALIVDPNKIRFELEKAVYLARHGRPGPVLIDIPDDVQRAEVHCDELIPFIPEAETTHLPIENSQISKSIELLNAAERPVFIVGWGVRLSGAEKELKQLVKETNIPMVLTWAAKDLFPSEDPIIIGTFGTHGSRFGNYAVQNADLIISIGSRLDTHHTGSPTISFAREAAKIVVDIDRFELQRIGLQVTSPTLLIQSDAKQFIRSLRESISDIQIRSISQWKKQIEAWKEQYPVCLPHYADEQYLNPYLFFKALSVCCREGDIFFADTGCSLAWMMQSFDFKKNQRLFSAFNFTPMGYALPASIGACFAKNGQRVICVSGDGGLQMNIQELATIVRHQLPIKIFVMNNQGYGMIQQTQDQWLESRYEASTVESGLAFPDFEKVALAYGFKVARIEYNKDISDPLKEILFFPGPALCNVIIKREHRVIPQCKFGRPLEDQEPLLQRNEFFKNMLIEPLDVSSDLES